MTNNQPDPLHALLRAIASEPDTLAALGPALRSGMRDPDAIRSMPLIGLCGPKECGKSTVSKDLARLLLGLKPHQQLHPSQSVRRLRFAGAVKAMLRALGLSEAQVDGDKKETPSELLGGKTPREAMQSLGTEWGRDLVSPDLWCNATMQLVDDSPDDVIVIDDVRFDNEAAAIRARGGYVIEIFRAGTSYNSEHASEAGLPRALIDVSVPNNDHPTETVLRVAAYVLTRRIAP